MILTYLKIVTSPIFSERPKADFAIFTKYKTSNRGIGIIFFMIDTFSRFLSFLLLKTKSAPELVSKLPAFFHKLRVKFPQYRIKSLRTDRDPTFMAHSYLKLLKELSISPHYALEIPKVTLSPIITPIFLRYRQHLSKEPSAQSGKILVKN